MGWFQPAPCARFVPHGMNLRGAAGERASHPL